MKGLKTVFAWFKEKAKSSQVKAAVLAVGIASAMAPVAFATENGVTLGEMASILASMAVVVSLVGSVWDLITSNPLLTVFLAAALLTVGITIFKRIKRAVK